MRKLSDWKLLFAAIGVIGLVLLASPTIALIVKTPKGGAFSELWILGPEHMAEGYPFNVFSEETHTIWLGLRNHVGSSVYHVIYAKIRNQSEPLPNATAGLPSPLQVLYEYHVFLSEGEGWESKVEFSLGNFTLVSSENRTVLESLALNGVVSRVDKETSWDVNWTGYYYQLLFELWIYSPQEQALKFDNRYVYLWLNVTG